MFFGVNNAILFNDVNNISSALLHRADPGSTIL